MSAIHAHLPIDIVGVLLQMTLRGPFISPQKIFEEQRTFWPTLCGQMCTFMLFNVTKRESGGFGMRIVLGTIGLIIAATPALATSVPAPLLGLGIPAAVIVGGVLLGARLFKRK